MSIKHLYINEKIKFLSKRYSIVLIKVNDFHHEVQCSVFSLCPSFKPLQPSYTSLFPCGNLYGARELSTDDHDFGPQ